ncbi:acVLRF1 family peptidyl-tRNA hydrolase [Nocardioides dongxiaopingii]|uniref:acVLRF1 family peptidyl-tRNA hydrolase n=1 Tax=Nocardioides TaxID=1839 RepID=UPI001BAEE744|nr:MULTISPECIES: acVLRF1 family peptidyl-tRNA hydrolase [Nocardioides]
MATVLVPAARWARWLDNFERSHGPTAHAVADGVLTGTAEDGSRFAVRLPFDRALDAGHDGAPAALADRVVVPDDWGVLLVRKGGFAMARLRGTTLGESKTGQRHVQGRTKAGGQSQQRFARRRDNQARQAYEAAADHAARILGGLHGPLVTGGDHGAVDEVLADPRLRGAVVVAPWLAVPDPRRSVLEQAVADATALQVEVVNA